VEKSGSGINLMLRRFDMFEIPVVDDTEVKKGNRRQGIQLCYPFDEKRLLTWKKPYIIQPKLDGVRCRALINNGEIHLVSSEGHSIDHVPHINESLAYMFPKMTIELDGELYLHGMTFQDIISRTSRSKNKHTNSESIQYHIFDIINNNQQIDRISELNKHGFFGVDNIVQVVPSSIARNLEEVMEMYAEYIDTGFEGFVIRDAFGTYQRKRYTGMMKFKPHQTDIYSIIGTQEEISIGGDAKGTLGAFICTSDEGTIFNVGTGLNQDQRASLWKERDGLVGKKLKVKFQSLTTGKGVPRFPVFLEVIGQENEL
jgi:ATP-dependent DNA ligase